MAKFEFKDNDFPSSEVVVIEAQTLEEAALILVKKANIEIKQL